MEIDKDYAIAIIGIVGALAGTVLGFFLTMFYDRLRERSRLKSELQSAINKVLFNSVVNEYPVALNELKRLIISNAQSFQRHKGLPEFFSKWLTNPALYFDRDFVGLHTDEQFKELKADLSAVKL